MVGSSSICCNFGCSSALQTSSAQVGVVPEDGRVQPRRLGRVDARSIGFQFRTSVVCLLPVIQTRKELKLRLSFARKQKNGSVHFRPQKHETYFFQGLHFRYSHEKKKWHDNMASGNSPQV